MPLLSVSGAAFHDGQPLVTNVYVIDQATGERIGKKTTNADGTYELVFFKPTAGPVIVVAESPSGYQPIAHGHVMPDVSMQTHLNLIEALQPTIFYDALLVQTGQNLGKLGNGAQRDLTSANIESADGCTWFKGPHITGSAISSHDALGSGTEYSSMLLIRKGSTSYGGGFGIRGSAANQSIWWCGQWSSGNGFRIEGRTSTSGYSSNLIAGAAYKYILLTMVRKGAYLKVYNGRNIFWEKFDLPADSPAQNITASIQLLQDGSYKDTNGRIGFATMFDYALDESDIMEVISATEALTGMQL